MSEWTIIIGKALKNYGKTEKIKNLLISLNDTKKNKII